MEVTPSDTAALPTASAAPTLATAWGQDRLSPLTKLPSSFPQIPPIWFWTLLPPRQNQIKSSSKMKHHALVPATHSRWGLLSIMSSLSPKYFKGVRSLACKMQLCIKSERLNWYLRTDLFVQCSLTMCLVFAIEFSVRNVWHGKVKVSLALL